jgi:hypothetical protein
MSDWIVYFVPKTTASFLISCSPAKPWLAQMTRQVAATISFLVAGYLTVSILSTRHR